MVDIRQTHEIVLVFQPNAASALEEDLLSRMTEMLCIDDPERADAGLRFLRSYPLVCAEKASAVAQ